MTAGRPAQARLSVVVVATDGPPDVPAALAAAAEVVVVLTGEERQRSATVVPVPAEAPYGARVAAGVAGVTGAVVVVTSDPAALTPAGLAGLRAHLAASPRTGVAVPLVVGADGRVVEAGVDVEHDGTLLAVGAGSDPGAEELAFPRLVATGAVPVFAVRRSLLAAGGGPDPVAPDAASVVLSLGPSLHRAGSRTEYVPAFRVATPAVPAATRVDLSELRRAGCAPIVGPRPVPGRFRGSGVAVRDAASGTRLLVLHPSLGPGDRQLVGQVAELAGSWPTARVTLCLTAGASCAEDIRHLRDAGTEVVVGPRDWSRWLDERAFHYTHVVATGTVLLEQLGVVLRRSQPQAARVLLADRLEPRRVAAMEPALGSDDERAGLRSVVADTRDRMIRALETVDAVWCGTAADRDLVRGLLPDLPTALLPHVLEPVVPDPDREHRSGLVVLGQPGSDVLAGHEDAAVVAACEVLPALRQGRPRLGLRIASGRPSPMLQRLCVRPGVTLDEPGPDGTAAHRQALLALAPYRAGDGGRAAIETAIRAGVPIVATRAAAADVELGALADLIVTDDVAGMTALARRMLSSPIAWEQVRAAVVALRDRASTAELRLALTGAGAELGIAPPTPADLVRDPAARPALPEVRPVPRQPPPQLRLRRQGTHRLGPAPPSDRAGVVEQYRRWRERHEPVGEALAEIGRRASSAASTPLISIVMPTYETDPGMLEEALASVAAQVYPHWQLCVADDCSVRPEVREVLTRWADKDERVVFDLRPTRSGIAATSNAALAMATGEWVCFLDHDDELKPHALAEVVLRLDAEPDLDLIYTDEDKRTVDGELVEPFFKPDWSPDHLLSRNYLNHLTLVRRRLVEEVGGLRSDYDGSQDYDLVLRVTERTSRIGHIALPLYTWRMVPGSTAAAVADKPYALEAARRALAAALHRRGVAGTVTDGLLGSTYRVRYALVGSPRIRVVIPTRDGYPLLRRCIESIRRLSTYDNYEIVVVDNQSTDPAVLAYMATAADRVLRYDARFNYARMMNLASWDSGTDLLLYVNNDTVVRTPGWMEAMAEHAQRPEVGAVGCRLLYPDGRVQHEGVIVGFAGGAAGNVDHGGWWALGQVVRNCSAVTGAVTMMRRSVFAEVGGFEERLRVAFNDVDLCLRVRQAGYEVVYTPYAELEHHESASRGVHQHLEEDAFFDDRWAPYDVVDPYYNPNLDPRRPFRILA